MKVEGVPSVAVIEHVREFLEVVKAQPDVPEGGKEFTSSCCVFQTLLLTGEVLGTRLCVTVGCTGDGVDLCDISRGDKGILVFEEG